MTKYVNDFKKRLDNQVGREERVEGRRGGGKCNPGKRREAWMGRKESENEEEGEQ